MEQKVCAVVVTFNRRALLIECLDALNRQTRTLDRILIIDNGSTDGTVETLRSVYADLDLICLPVNIGGAGGFHHGVKEAYESGYDWVWLMDDDGRPSPDCLEKLLVKRIDRAALIPVQQNSQGHLYGIGVWKGMDRNVTDEIVRRVIPLEGDYIFSFVGPLISRSLIKEIGLPNKEFFIWYDDIEYALRIRALPRSRIIVVPEAIFFHDYGGASREVSFLGRKSFRTNQPSWKSYYSARNPLYIITRVHKSFRHLLGYIRWQLQFAIGELIYEQDRWTRLSLRFRGWVDGALGRMGKRVSP